MYAIIKTGNKQYRVSPKDIFEVESLSKKTGASVTLTDVLVVGDGEKIHFGAPKVKNASVVCEVLGEPRGRKVIAFKFRRREHYRKIRGHRQQFTRLQVKEIVLKGE